MIPCPHCDRRPFSKPNDAFNHIKAKHGKGLARRFWREHMPEREQSIGEQLGDALIAAACGEDVPEHIAMMFPDDFDEVRRRREEASR